MSIIGRVGRAAVKRFGRGAARGGAMSAAQKRALAKAVKASALARTKNAGATVAKGASRRVAKKAARASAIKNTESLALRRVTRGFKMSGLRRVDSAQFSGTTGRALKKASYSARLASSRAQYVQSSVANRVGQKALGVGVTGNVMRRRYSDLTTGENVRRNISRYLKVAIPVNATVGTAYYTNMSRNKI